MQRGGGQGGQRELGAGRCCGRWAGLGGRHWAMAGRRSPRGGAAVRRPSAPLPRIVARGGPGRAAPDRTASVRLACDAPRPAARAADSDAGSPPPSTRRRSHGSESVGQHGCGPGPLRARDVEAARPGARRAIRVTCPCSGAWRKAPALSHRCAYRAARRGRVARRLRRFLPLASRPGPARCEPGTAASARGVGSK